MRIFEANAVYGGTFGEDIVGFRCSNLGDICNKCRLEECRHKEFIEAIKDEKRKNELGT